MGGGGYSDPGSRAQATRTNFASAEWIILEMTLPVGMMRRMFALLLLLLNAALYVAVNILMSMPGPTRCGRSPGSTRVLLVVPGILKP